MAKAETVELTPEQQQIKNLEEQLARAREQLAQVLRQNEGWLVTSPNVLYDGSTAGIHFVNGVAFVGKDQHVPYFDQPPPNATKIREQYQRKIADGDMTKEEVKAIIEQAKVRHARSTAEKAVEALSQEFGYKVEYFSADRLEELQKRMGDRANQRRQAESAMRAKMNAEALIPPGYMGG